MSGRPWTTSERQATHSGGSQEELRVRASKIQRELIDEPLLKLEEKLRRLESVRRRKWASYAMTSVAAALVTAVAPAVAPTVAAALGGASLLKIMETYFTDLERDIPLKEDALYWLSRLRRK